MEKLCTRSNWTSRRRLEYLDETNPMITVSTMPVTRLHNAQASIPTASAMISSGVPPSTRVWVTDDIYSGTLRSKYTWAMVTNSARTTNAHSYAPK